jgi:hypothetical protein
MEENIKISIRKQISDIKDNLSVKTKLVESNNGDLDELELKQYIANDRVVFCVFENYINQRCLVYNINIIDKSSWVGDNFSYYEDYLLKCFNEIVNDDNDAEFIVGTPDDFGQYKFYLKYEKGVDSDKSTPSNSVEENIGKFKPNRKFLNFISGVSGAKVRFVRETAFIDGKQLSGILEGVRFKITICDEGTIDFEEVDTNQCDESMIRRLVESIDEMDVTGYTQKFVVANLEFKDKDGNRCYLEVEHQKPIEKFASILDILNNEESIKNTEVSDKCLSILDDLFSSDDKGEEFDVETVSEKDSEAFIDSIENPAELNDKLEPTALTYMEEQFRKMNEEKVKELESRIEKTQKEINRYKYDISQAEKKVEQEKGNLSVLETRLESLKPKDEPNGYVFNVSELKKNIDLSDFVFELDEKTQEVASKIADLMGLKKDFLFEQLKGGYHIIKIADKSRLGESPNINTEVLMKIKNLDIDGKISMVSDGDFEYRGDLSWHQLVDRMIKKGFEQDEEFDRLSGSNSYESKLDIN